MKVITLIIIFFISFNLFATVTSSVANGDWGDNGTWDNGVPDCGDTIHILHIVTIEDQHDYSACGEPMYLEIEATLKFKNGKKLNLPEGSGIDLHASGDFDAGNGGGNSNLIAIGGNTVWNSGIGDMPGPAKYGSPLPVALISFQALFNEDRVDLTWSTASEINNEFFIIERSKDGFEWQEITVISGAMNSTTMTEYFEIDYAPFTGVSYYRLKQIDFDGKETVFNVVPVENIEGGMIAFNIFPNPTTQDNINLSFKGFQNETILVVVRDIQGKEYYSEVTVVQDNDEIQLLSIDNNLPKGVYLVTASSVNELYSQKVIIK